MSRHDLDGFFWSDVERVSTRGQKVEVNRPLPPIPDTGWRPPAEFPNLSAAKVIALDCETYDPELLVKGPGVRRGGYIVGLALGTDDGGRWYFPMRHAVGAEMNLDPDAVMRFAKDVLRGEQPKVGANLLYDLDFLAAEGVQVGGKYFDVQIAEPLIDENARSYSLATLSKKYLGESKVDEELYKWSHVAYGGKEGRAQAANIWRSPPQLVGPYAEGDVDLPLRIFEKQWPIIQRDGLERVFDIETRLIPMLLAMRQRGVRVDLEGAQRAYEDMTARIKQAEQSMGGINVYAAEDIARYCKKNGIAHGKTARGNPSFDKAFLERSEDEGLRRIAEVRKWYKARDTFIDGYILQCHTNGRLHCSFNQLRSDDSGTVSGRFSSSDPNLQNIPNRDPYIGPLVRRLFLPDEGQTWVRYDWSQIEFRFLTHYATGDGADEAREMYRRDPGTDFHVMTAELTGIDRKPAKSINFGLVYGMGEPSMAANLGRSVEDVKPLFATYHGRMPFVRTTFNKVSQVAANRGYIMTMLGRRRRFNEWEPAKWGTGEAAIADEAAAREKWGRVRRAYTHKALNALLQGGAADAMKMAMVAYWESGIAKEVGAPLLTVHDELDFSVAPEHLRHLDGIQEILEKTVPLRVPVIADREIGPNWGELDEE